jgi:hypothetical protein
MWHSQKKIFKIISEFSIKHCEFYLELQLQLGL